MYLLTISSIAHVNLDIILGCSENKLGLLELIKNYYDLAEKCFNNTFEQESTINEINIYVLSCEDYKYFEKLFKKYKNKIDDKLNELKYDYSPFMECIWYLVYREESDNIDFTSNECKKIISIINNSKQMI